jgi:methylenetetrahydrofolate reductase (NADPH)
MKIIDIVKNNEITVSCEMFPPKAGTALTEVKAVVEEIAKLSPAYMSVTYGAGGGTRKTTVDVVDEIQNVRGITALAHLTCVSCNRDKAREVLSDLKSKGIENILALRGDAPIGMEAETDFLHASDLTKEIKSFGDFCVGGACYPEGHPEAPSLDADIENLKYKIDAGCEFLTTQMFFENHVMYAYLLKLLKAGINVPVFAGIMPITRVSQIKRTCALSGCNLPERFKRIADRFANDPQSMEQAGIAYATEQIIDLIANGVNNIHIYTMNNPRIAGKIFDNLSSIIKH